MSFSFIKPEIVDKKLFKRCVNKVSAKNAIQLHILNDSVMKSYNKTINEFLSYLIKVGEYLEEYESCSKLIIQQELYSKWLQTNLETVKGISKLIENLTDNDKQK